MCREWGKLLLESHSSDSLVWKDCRYAGHVKIEDVTDTMGKKDTSLTK